MEKIEPVNNDRVKVSKPAKKKSERVAVTGEGSQKVKRWKRYLLESYPSLEFSMTALANEMMKGLPERPSKAEMQRLNERFFNKRKLLKWIDDQMKKAEQDGTEFDPTPHLQPLITKIPKPKVTKIKPKNAPQKAVEKKDETVPSQ